MKRKLCSVALVLWVVATAVTFAGTDDPPSGHNALRKLGRGFANLVFGIIEVPNQYTKTAAENGGSAGVGYGIPKGIGRWLARECVGVYEIISFPIPAPKGYKPIMEPEWPNEDFEP